MSIAALIRSMSAAGAPPEAIALAVEAIEAAEGKVEEKRRIERERKRRQRDRDKNGTVTGQSRDSHGDVTPDPSPSLSPPQTPPNTHPHPRGVVSIARARGPFPMPEGVDPDHWRDFLANRKRKNRSNTPTAHKRLMDDLARWTDDEWPPGRLIEHAAARGWAGIYDPREERIDARQQRKPDLRESNGLRGSRPDPALDMWREACADQATERDPEADFGARLSLPSFGAS